MRDDARPEREPREIRLEGLGLAACGVALAVLLVGAFWLGRIVERGPGGAERSAGAAATAPETVVDVAAEQDYFDRSDDAGKELEPTREARRPTERRAPQQAPAVGDGAWLVQVWAGRDRPTGERLVSALEEAGFGVRMFSETSGGDTLYKVRVGGYATDALARQAVDDLQARGYRGAWVLAPP
jgi:cell division septation protein DedD